MDYKSLALWSVLFTVIIMMFMMSCWNTAADYTLSDRIRVLESYH